MPELSILMPVYNCERYLADAVESIINQTYTDWELYVCDDGSTDRTRNILQRYIDKDARINIVFNENNIGKIATVTRLYQMIKGNYVVFHDSDDVSHAERFAIQIRALKEDESLGLVGCGYTMINSNGGVLQTVQPAEHHHEIVKAMETSSPFHFPTIMFNRRYLEMESQLFRPFFGDNNEDVDLAYRVLTRSKGKNINRVLYVYRILENSISRKRVLRNSIYFYCVARDLALARIAGRPDWLDDPVSATMQLRKYETLTDKGRILIYANAVSYFLSYRMHKKALRAALASITRVPAARAIGLVVITMFKVAVSVLKYRDRDIFDFAGFSRNST